MKLINKVAEVFFYTILGMAQKTALEKFLNKYPEIVPNRNNGTVYTIECVALKIGDNRIPLPEEFKKEYESLVLEEVYYLTDKIINNTKEIQND